MYDIEYYEYNKTIEPYTKTSNGTMVYRSMNRYFLDQQFIYQAGAVFLCQPPNASMRILPYITIEDVGAGLRNCRWGLNILTASPLQIVTTQSA
jgi:hypothetical protein